MRKGSRSTDVAHLNTELVTSNVWTFDIQCVCLCDCVCVSVCVLCFSLCVCVSSVVYLLGWLSCCVEKRETCGGTTFEVGH